MAIELLRMIKNILLSVLSGLAYFHQATKM
jgi:hypothetical protein